MLIDGGGGLSFFGLPWLKLSISDGEIRLKPDWFWIPVGEFTVVEIAIGLGLVGSCEAVAFDVELSFSLLCTSLPPLASIVELER
ncbi:hypothetical protein Leryth_010378 [Lithospermum erythrorhizon]|nr:hypothetical protein Leryth_010378 [Lithospermum erythrorhizon]